MTDFRFQQLQQLHQLYIGVFYFGFFQFLVLNYYHINPSECRSPAYQTKFSTKSSRPSHQLPSLEVLGGYLQHKYLGYYLYVHVVSTC